MEQPVNQSRRAIALFLLFLFAFSSVYYYLIIHAGHLGAGGGIYVTGLMWCPALSAFITSLILKRKISAMAWGWNRWRYQLGAYAVPLLYATIAYIIIWIAGWGSFYNTGMVASLAKSFGWESLPNCLVITLYFIFAGTVGMVMSLATGLGEEIGWRGFLVPEVFKTAGYTKTSLIVGCIWAMWHFPILLFADYNSGTPAWYGLTCFTVMVVSISFIFTWYRLRSGSLWTAAILHASHNLFIQEFFTPMTKDTGHTRYFVDEFGAVLPVVCLAFAVYFWTRRKELAGVM